jgi:hypothetical protein
MRVIQFIVFISLVFVVFACNMNEKYKRDLQSNNVNKIDNACYKLGESKDTSAVKLLLTNILDPRMSTNLRFKGMSTSYCRLGALKKISGLDMGRPIDQFSPDTTAVFFYLDWAVHKGFIKDRADVNIYYSTDSLK